MKFVQAWLSARIHRESNFQHGECSVKLLQANLVRERSDIVVLTIVETCESRVGMFIYEE